MDPTRSLLFIPFEFDIYEQGPCVHVGRFTDRRNNTETTNAATHDEARTSPEATSTQAATQSTTHEGRTIAAIISDDQTRITFKSKVVSRMHAELKCEPGGKIFLRDTGSSSGTFLNQTRLSSPGALSKYHEVVDGDVLQFGIDYQGGVQEIFRCIKLRIEIDKEFRIKPSQFSHNMLRAVQERGSVQGSGGVYSSSAPVTHARDAQPAEKSQNIAECCICLFKIAVCQALFIAPCSHAFHYKCIRPLLQLHHPGFMCPLCRTFSNLDEDVDDDEEHIHDIDQQCHDSATNNEEFFESEMFAAASSQLHLGPANPSCPSSPLLSNLMSGAMALPVENSRTNPFLSAHMDGSQ
ncbi:hypothetical protein MVES_000303 [Malassezia vespertilionis]|uniref:Dma1p n=2 Tax=Malassezia vespertilionis TaxID=2020962 RepID=A0A2N1JFS3_9BASI|nr:hypothetical protein MVES_000303 [Malassezia vespertilionis]